MAVEGSTAMVTLDIPHFPKARDRKDMQAEETATSLTTQGDDMSSPQTKDLLEEIAKLKTQLHENEIKRNAYKESITASEEYARIVGNYVATCEFWTAPQGELIYISPSCETMTGYPPKDFLEDEKLLTNIIVDEDLEYVATELKQVLMNDDHNDRLEICFQIRRRDGVIRCIKQISQKVFGEGGVYLGRRASNIDLTELGISPEDCQRLR